MKNARQIAKRRNINRGEFRFLQIKRGSDNKTDKTYKNISFAVWLLMLSHLLNSCGLITWRTERDHHWSYIFKTIDSALDDDRVFEGASEVVREFIFDIFNLGGWIKFALMASILYFILNNLPVAVKLLRSFISRHGDKISAVLSASANALKNISPLAIASIVESAIKFGAVGCASQTANRTVGISCTINGVYYCGGIVVKGSVRVKRLRMMSQNDIEIIHQFDRPITIVGGKNRVCICGKLTDWNNTVQRRKMLGTEPEDIMIGSRKYSVNVSH